MRNLIFSLLFVFLLPLATFSQNPAKWSLDVSTGDAKLRQGDKLDAKLKAEIEAGWHLYALDHPPGGPVATTIKVAQGWPYEVNGKIRSPEPQNAADKNFIVDGKPLLTKFFTESVEFTIPLRAVENAVGAELRLDVRYQLCNDTFCLPPKTVRASMFGSEDIKKNASNAAAAETVIATAEQGQLAVGPTQQDDLGTFIWLAITLGALSLLTPCVFPMIPITVSYFTNHSSGSRAKAVRLASVYSLGIVATFTLVGMLLAIFVGAAGINLFAANPWINLLITGIFLFFAFNLFGAYEINIPTGVLTKLDRITRTHEGEGSGVIGALLMGLTFTLTSFTCTSPFVGTILVSASQGNWQRPLIGMLAFSAVFALPFFILALVPQWIAQLPRAGGWMNSVKVAMGFLEVAAAMKFLSNVDLVWKWGIFTRSVVLAIWIAIGVILSLYLLGKFQLAHDSKPERIGAFRLASAIVSLAISFYLITGLFGAKLGEIEAFLPPDLEVSASSKLSPGSSESAWIVNDYAAALAKAKAENKRVFVDFTGYTCTNCRWMEANVFPKPEVATAMNKFVLVRLYTDGEGELYEKQQQMEQDMFGTVALPFYAVIDGDGKAVASYPGLTRNTAEFTEFLTGAAAK
ncbi:MAG: cytochrome c biogenesis protein CcdA [Acidobacteriota bacterium]